MKRIAIVGAVAGLTAVAVMSCRDQADGDVEVTTSALLSISSQVRAYKRADGGEALVFRQDGQSTITELRGPPGARIQTDIGGVSGGTPWGYKRSDNVNAVVYIDGNRHLHELSQWNGSWLDNDFYSAYGINAPLAQTANQDVFGYVRKDGVNIYVYTDTSQHVIEVRSNFGGSGAPWLPADLTAILGALPSNSVSPYPYRHRYRDGIVYGASDQHVHELQLDGGIWTDHDISVESGDLTSPSSQPWANDNGGQNQAQVVFTGADAKLHRLYAGVGCASTGAWCSEVLSSTNLSPIHRPVSFFSSDNSPSVLYVAGGGGAGDTLHLVSKQGGLTASPWVDTAVFSGGSSSLGNPFGYVPGSGRSSAVFRKSAAGSNWGVEAWKYCSPGAGGGSGGLGGAGVPCSGPPWLSEEF
jgi:hypothetical protein